MKECNYGDYSTTEYASHKATTRYEQYSASQHKKYSHCTDCDTTIGSVSYENHSFTSTTSNGQVVSTCSLCGYTKTTAQTYTISYNANGGSNVPASQTKVHGVTLTLSSTIPYRFNYEFLGWSTSSSATTATYTAGGSYTGNVSVTLYAVWKYKPTTYTVSYDANGGTGAPGRQTKTYGVTLTLTTIQPTRRNYLFLGWSKDRNATSASYSAGGSYTDNADVTLYAVWRYDPETYTIRYDANGGTGAPASQTKTYGVPLTLSAVKPTRAGYEFLGWSTDPTTMLTNYAPGERYTDEASITLYRSVWAIREYPPQTSDQALLARFGDKEAVTVHLYTRLVDGVEQRKILQNASRKNKLLANSNDLEDSVTGEGNLGDVVELLGELRKNREPLLHCAVFIELSAGNLDKLRELQSDVSMEMTREKISVDHLSMRQKEGFIACMPCGYNIFGTQYERVLPASAVANLFPFNYSGKTDKNGFYLGKDKFGTNIIADFDQRADDKTNSNVLILGNSGQGKSYLLKLILVNLRMSGKSVISLDAEQEYKDLCDNLGGCYVDLMIGEYIINPLEPKEWSDNGGEADADSPEAFRKATRLSQHISYLKDFFRVYKDFDDAQIDALEILLSRLYAKFGITDNTDYDKLKADDYPVMADLYAMVESEYQRHEKGSKSLFTEDLLRELCLGLNSMMTVRENTVFSSSVRVRMTESLSVPKVPSMPDIPPTCRRHGKFFVTRFTALPIL